jgi:hypothetical protein
MYVRLIWLASVRQGRLRVHIFAQKIQFGYTLEGLGKENIGIFYGHLGTCSLCQFGIFYDHWVY